MHERLKESLSALKDGEADELELRRLLNELDDNPELSQTWARYEMMGALMRDEAISTVDLSRGIRQAIDGEPMDEVPAAQPAAIATTSSGQWQQWLTGGAVAASVTLAVLLGVRLDSESVQPASVAQTQAPAAAVSSQPSLTAQPVMLPVQSEQQVASRAVQPVQNDMALPEAQRKLQQYVLQHTEHAALNTGRGMMPFARVASFAERQAEPAKPAQPQQKRQDAQQ